MENFTKLKQAIDIMGQILPNYVHKKMDKQLGVNAFTSACETFPKNSSPRNQLEKKGWDNGVDLYIALRLINRHCNIFQSAMGENAWSYCSRMLFYRNLVAHNTPSEVQKFNKDPKIDTYLEEIAVFVKAVAPEKVKSIEQLKAGSASAPEKKVPEKVLPVLEDTPPEFLLRTGERKDLTGLINPEIPVLLHLNVVGKGMYRFSCFGLNESDVLADSQYIICEEMQNSPKKEIIYQRKSKDVYFTINLKALPEAIRSLTFTISMDNGNATAMNDISGYIADIAQNSKKIVSFSQNGSDFSAENAIISVITLKLYFKNNAWRAQAVGNGFNKKFDELKSYFGQTEA